MHYRIRYMYVKYQLNRNNRFVKTVITKKNFNCINSQLAIRISKPNFFQTCITRPPIDRPNLRSIGMLVIVQPRSKEISTDDGRTDRQTDGRTDIASDNIRYFFFEKKKTTKNITLHYFALKNDLKYFIKI